MPDARDSKTSNNIPYLRNLCGLSKRKNLLRLERKILLKRISISCMVPKGHTDEQYTLPKSRISRISRMPPP